MPKERRRYASKCTDLVKQLEAKVLQYTTLLPFGQRARQPVVLADIRQCSFAWMEEYGAGETNRISRPWPVHWQFFLNLLGPDSFLLCQQGQLASLACCS